MVEHDLKGDIWEKMCLNERYLGENVIKWETLGRKYNQVGQLSENVYKKGDFCDKFSHFSTF